MRGNALFVTRNVLYSTLTDRIKYTPHYCGDRQKKSGLISSLRAFKCGRVKGSDTPMRSALDGQYARLNVRLYSNDGQRKKRLKLRLCAHLSVGAKGSDTPVLNALNGQYVRLNVRLYRNDRQRKKRLNELSAPFAGISVRTSLTMRNCTRRNAFKRCNTLFSLRRQSYVAGQSVFCSGQT